MNLVSKEFLLVYWDFDFLLLTNIKDPIVNLYDDILHTARLKYKHTIIVNDIIWEDVEVLS